MVTLQNGRITNQLNLFLQKNKIIEHIGQVMTTIWSNIYNSVYNVFELVSQGFSYFLNGNDGVYGKNVFLVIFDNVLSATFRKINEEVTLIKVLRLFGKDLNFFLPNYPNLEKYIKHGKRVLTQVGDVVNVIQGVLSGEGQYDVAQGYRQNSFGPGKYFVTNKDVSMSGKNVWIRQKVNDLRTEVLSVPIDEARWPVVGVKLNEFFNNVIEKHAGDYAFRISTSDLHTGIPNPFDDSKQWGAIQSQWDVLQKYKVGPPAGIVQSAQQLQGLAHASATATEYVTKPAAGIAGFFIATTPLLPDSWKKAGADFVLHASNGNRAAANLATKGRQALQSVTDGPIGQDGDIILKNLRYSSYDDTLINTFKKQYQGLKLYKTYINWWDDYQNNYNYLIKCYNGQVVEKIGPRQYHLHSTASDEYFGVGDMGKMIYMLCITPIIISRLDRDIKITKQMIQHDKWISEKNIGGIVRSSLYSKYEEIKNTNMSYDDSRLKRLIYSIEKGSMRPSQYLKFVKQFLNDLLNNDNKNEMFGGINRDTLYGIGIDGAILISVVKIIVGKTKEMVNRFNWSYFPTNVPIKVKKFSRDGKTIMCIENANYVSRNYNNITDIKILESKTGSTNGNSESTISTDGYVTSVHLSLKIIQQFVSQEKSKLVLYEQRKVKLKIFSDNITQLGVEK